MKVKIRQLMLEDFADSPEYQRERNSARIQKLASAFEPSKLGVVAASRRNDGLYHIMDGQHRIAAAAAAGFRGPFLVAVFEGMSVAEEADHFIGLNDRVALLPVARFRARLAAGEPEALAIKQVIDGHGFSLTEHRSARGFGAISTVVRLYRAGVLEDTLTVIREAWNFAPGSTSAYVLQAIGTVFLTRTKVDSTKMVSALRTVFPDALTKQLQSLAGAAGLGRARLSANEIIRLYNRMNAGKIPYLRPGAQHGVRKITGSGGQGPAA